MESGIQFLLYTFIGTGLIFISISIPLIRRKIKINHWYGIRLPKTMKDEKTWYEVNEICAKHLFVFGIIITIFTPIILISELFSNNISILINIFLIIVGTVLIVILTFRTTDRISRKNNPK